MARIITIADKASGVALGLIALANLLFVLSFIILLLVGSSHARADQAAACTGQNLLAELERSDPAKFELIRHEADRTLNGKGLLWRIEKDGLEPSFLFGTMHLTDDRVTDLTDEARTAFEQANTVVIETTDILDEGKAAMALLAHPELMMLPGSDSLRTLLSAEDLAVVTEALDGRGIPLGSVIKMQPWLLTATISIPACEFARRKGGLSVLDAKLAHDAEALGKEIAGLETGVSQLQAMASLPMDLHLQGLVQTLKLGDRINDMFETLIVLYLDGEIGMVWPLFKSILPTDDPAGYGEFERVMITTRNHGMVENAEPFLQAGGAFIAVGALHLPGEEGIVELLRNTGYRVTQAD
ncbi:MAG: TraB/GumN family protein [Rhizobiaceae bacterium]